MNTVKIDVAWTSLCTFPEYHIIETDDTIATTKRSKRSNFDQALIEMPLFDTQNDTWNLVINVPVDRESKFITKYTFTAAITSVSIVLVWTLYTIRCHVFRMADETSIDMPAHRVFNTVNFRHNYSPLQQDVAHSTWMANVWRKWETGLIVISITGHSWGESTGLRWIPLTNSQ